MQYFSFSITAIKSTILAAITVALLGLLLVLPQSASAYNTTAQSVTKLTDNILLFQVTYRFNFLNRDMRTPVLASRVTATDTSSPLLQYSLRDSAGEAIATGNSTAIVLSDAVVKDKQYFLPAGTPGSFTLMAIVQLPSAAVATGGEASLQIDWLPFTLIKDGEETLARVPNADITPFKTPSIAW